MNVCPTCGYKVISNTMFKRHLELHEVVPTEEKKAEEQVQPVPEAPVAPVNPEITIHFSKPVEVWINGISYCGKDVTVHSISIASEVVRIAREAYGPTILL